MQLDIIETNGDHLKGSYFKDKKMIWNKGL